MDLLSIPGYVRAILQERTVRDAAFLGFTESIGPFEVQPMTLRHLMVLRITGSPFARLEGEGELPTPDQVRDFLWLLSPEFTSGPSKAKKRFAKHCRKLFYPPRYLPLFNTERARRRHEIKCDVRRKIAAYLIESIRAFVAETMQDRPPTAETKGYQADYYSDGAAFSARFAREYGWAEESTLNMPLKKLYQYLNEMRQFNGSSVPMCNPSDRIKGEWLRNINRQRKEQQ